jgi:hypothetical protein
MCVRVRACVMGTVGEPGALQDRDDAEDRVPPAAPLVTEIDQNPKKNNLHESLRVCIMS